MGMLFALAVLFGLLWAFSCSDSEIVPKDGTILVNYWPHSSGRATAILHVLAAGKGKYQHKELTAESVVDQTLATVHPAGGHSWALADGRDDEIARGKVALQMSPPVLVDQTESKEGFAISQTGAILNYLGRKYNMYPEGQPHDKALAEQYILDQQDFYNNMWGPGGHQTSADYAAKAVILKKFVYNKEHGKLHLWLGTINRQIKGPFYFGKKPTYVDFALVGVLSVFTDMHRETIKVLGKDPVEAYPKIAQLRNELKKGRDGYSYSKVQKLCNATRVKEEYVVQPEVAKQLKSDVASN